MTFVKFCGMTRAADVARACELGVSAVGFVLWPKSPRFVPNDRLTALVRGLPADVTAVGVLVDPSADDLAQALDAGVHVVQVHGTMQAAARVETWIAAHLETDMSVIPEGHTVVLDAHDPVRHGGTGRTIDWRRAATVAARRRVLLAGGLTPENVGTAIREVRPYGVDVASGIEEAPGIKSARAMEAFVAAVRETDA